jgi:hypothetical protein
MIQDGMKFYTFWERSWLFFFLDDEMVESRCRFTAISGLTQMTFWFVNNGHFRQGELQMRESEREWNVEHVFGAFMHACDITIFVQNPSIHETITSFVYDLSDRVSQIPGNTRTISRVIFWRLDRWFACRYTKNRILSFLREVPNILKNQIKYRSFQLGPLMNARDAYYVAHSMPYTAHCSCLIMRQSLTKFQSLARPLNLVLMPTHSYDPGFPPFQRSETHRSIWSGPKVHAQPHPLASGVRLSS